jgi:hypothetical protein
MDQSLATELVLGGWGETAKATSTGTGTGTVQLCCLARAYEQTAHGRNRCSLCPSERPDSLPTERLLRSARGSDWGAFDNRAHGNMAWAARVMPRPSCASRGCQSSPLQRRKVTRKSADCRRNRSAELLQYKLRRQSLLEANGWTECFFVAQNKRRA